MVDSGRLDVAVLGAGVMGLVAAVTLVRAGLRVVVHERAADITASAAWRSGGMLAPDCEAEIAEPLVVALGRRSLALWPSLVPGVETNGTLVVAPPREPGVLTRFERLTHNHRSLDEEALGALEPALAGRYRRGLFFPHEGHLDPRRTLRALQTWLREAGVPIEFGFSGDPDSLNADRIVDARGLGARDRFPTLRGVKGEMALVRSRDVSLARPVRLLHHRHPLYVVPREGGVFMIGATTIESESPDPSAETRVTLRSAGELLTQAYALHPAFAEAEILELNAGLRPAFPDNAPRIEISGRTIAVNGLYRHGWLLAPALAARIVDVLLGKVPTNEVMHADPAEW
ncbi:FAD-dependent oxidoreductase [Polyangium jinanense]|uniref:FAD-dependent oxidoreductase n=1 Tax=Polyangium jinanense TaxID=2829994 RepID=UPI002341EBA0|nr:FAD-dependent oxidoreductase [Polyangium jinanense]MDC3958690.1 FAD-dependent oxidoreductase [Polyangium jinanense]